LDSIIDPASDMAQNQTSTSPVEMGIKAVGQRDGVTISVIVTAEGEVITGYPVRESRTR
jgi:hypothetical protein